MDLVMYRLASFARDPHMRTVLMCAVLLAIASANVFAQGIIDTSQIQTEGNAIVRLCLWAAAATGACALAFGIFKVIGNHPMAGISWIVGSLIAEIIIGRSLGWTLGLTGISVGQ